MRGIVKQLSKKLMLAGLFVLTLGLTNSLGSWIGYQNLEQLIRNELFRYTSLLEDLMGRHQVMAPILASDQLFLELVDAPTETNVERANDKLKTFADLLQMSSDIYVMDINGRTMAASNWDKATSFVGRNFSFRPYFQQALTGSEGFYFALGTTSLVRGLYFSSPILSGDTVKGVLTLKINVNELEHIWKVPGSLNLFDLVVADKDSVVFLSTQQDWRYKSVRTLDDKRLTTIGDERRYPGITVEPLGLSAQPLPAGLNTDVSHYQLGGDSLIAVSQPMPVAGWTVSVYGNTRNVRYDQLSAILLGVFVFAALLGVVLYLRERQARLEHLESSRKELESRVARRTEDLLVTNRRLMNEIDVRSRAEIQLKSTQDELIQAAKLATLGQMSASINHELNQPLTAIKAFSANARKFLQRGNLEQTDKNLEEIIQLCERMGNIIRQFKMFTRKSSSKLVAIDLCQIITDARHLMQPVIETSPAKVVIQGADGQPVWVAGDMVRLEQVLVNLLSNAIQATRDAEQPEIRINLNKGMGSAIIQVSDNGVGIIDTQEIFEPFFTTKDISEGLGLGLSISRQIIETMGGTLSAANGQSKGAVFSIRLPLLVSHTSATTAANPVKETP
jgi:two-component system C4-dicarboxylate transport sensor histidine kinase DctB